MANPARLLVVDDHEANRDMLARRLKKRGYEVDTAEDGLGALRMVDQAPYDLVLLDVMMPGMSGLEVLEKLRETYPRADLPIVMATAKTESEDMVKALDLGANDYVTKPIDFPVVLARIQSHLQTRLQAPSLPAPAALFPADGKVPAGTILDGRYEVENTLGEGAFAIVFAATQISTGQRVAVKVLRHHRAGGDDSVDRKRFEREMKTIGKMRHPHIVRLIDFGSLKATVTQVSGWIETSGGAGFDVDETSGGTRVLVRQLPYIVMELVQGETLQAQLKSGGAMEPSDATDLALAIMSAIAEGHRVGVIHRDIKPPNVLVTRSAGRAHPIVLDFGISKPHGEDTLMRAEESFLGTPEYLAPEVLAGQTSADELADQYALGAMLYEMLAGTRPFRADSYVELIQDVAVGKYRPLEDAAPGVPPELAAVVDRAMDRDPERRFSSMLTFGRALLPFATNRGRTHWTPTFSVQSDPPPPPRTEARPPGERTSRDMLEAAVEAPGQPDALRQYGRVLAIAGLVMVLAAAAVFIFR